MPSIVIFCKTLLKGGAEKQALTLSKLLTEKGMNIILISWCGTHSDPSNLEFIRTNNLRFIGLKGSSIKKLSTFLKILKNEQISIVLSYLTNANFISGISKFFIKDLVSVGGIRTEKLPYYKYCFEKLIHNYLNDATVFNNFTGKEKLVQKGFNPSKIHVIHNTIQIPADERIQPGNDNINLISVCRFVKSKDFRTALSAFKKLLDNKPEKKIKYLIVGYGPLEHDIRQMVVNLNLQNNVEILINPPNVSGIFKKAHIYLSTSLYEGLSNSIMEAMVAGMPIVATDVGDNRYLIKDGINGFLVPCGNTDLIAEKLEYLVNTDDIRSDFGNNSRSIIEKEYSEEKFLENYSKLFSRMTLPLMVAPSIKL
jgi:glycosyltransferase involved in cell wall biosynthesis